MLEQLPASLVASQLTNEHPQTVAVLLSRLQPGSSAGILREMSPALQTELLQRISGLGAVSEQVIMELEQAVVELVSGGNGDQPNGVQGLATVQAILNATDPLHRHQLIDKLGGRYETDSIPQDPPVVDTAAPTPWLEQDVAGVSKVSTTDSGKFVIRFEDLAQLDDTSLATVIQSVDSQLVLLALAGASQDFVQRIMQPSKAVPIKANSVATVPPWQNGRPLTAMCQLRTPRRSTCKIARRTCNSLLQRCLKMLSVMIKVAISPESIL